MSVYKQNNTLKCSYCGLFLFKNKYSGRQIKEKGKRKCSVCLEKCKFSYDDIKNNLLSWLENNGADFKKLEIKQITPEYRDVFSTKYIKRNDEIMSIPEKCIIMLNDVYKTAYGEILKKYDICYHSIIAVKLLYEKNDTKSYWTPYLHILPTKYESVPLFYDDKNLEKIDGYLVKDMLQSRIIDLMKEYKNISDLIPLFSDTFTLHEFIWARTVVITRVFGFNKDGIQSSGLVPLADMLNHSLDPGTKWDYYEDKSSFIVHCTREIEKGQNVLDTYGYKCNSRYLVNYGFTLPYDINIYNNESTIFLDTKKYNLSPKHLELFGTPTTYDNGFCGYRLLIEYKQESNVSEKGMYRFQFPILSTKTDNTNVSVQIISSFFAFLRAINLKEEELPNNIQDLYKPVSVENEVMTMKLLYNICDDKLKEFKTDVEDDIKQLKTLDKFTSEYDIINTYISEKNVIIFYKELSNLIINENISKIGKRLKSDSLYNVYYKFFWKNIE